MRIAVALFLLLAGSTTATAQSPAAARAAIARALPLLQTSAATFVEQRACMSCHHNALPILTLRLAQARGLAVDRSVLAAVEAKTFRELRAPDALDAAVQGTSVSDPTPNDSLLLLAAHAAGVAPDVVTGVHARRMAQWQRADGRWITSDFRPPHSSSVFTATATAVRAIRAYLPAELAAERDRVTARARGWLASTTPHSTEDAAFRLMGLVWADAPAGDVQAAGRDLTALQRPDGGWGQTPEYAPDAYSTGQAVYALRLAGLGAAERPVARGVAFLVRTQAGNGTWRVRTRMLSPATVSPPYFKTGFPYGTDEFISYAGSCWAVMGLLSTLPESPAGAAPAARPTAPETSNAAGSTASTGTVSGADSPWLRTALFGTAGDLAALLDRGLAPNSATAGGTTVLMAAAPEADKVRLLLARGADARTRAESGADAVTAAATAPGTAAAIRLLLDAGADAAPPADVRVRRPPLVFAAMTGDLETVRLLLDRKAPARADAAAEAVTFGHADVVQALVGAGADVGGTERSGINLLHWATITNRASVIPVLAKAGVDIDAQDDHGYTPLMYAATIDQGDAETLRALLAAGADRTIRNDEGRTPLAQARRLKHVLLAEVLK